MAASAVGISSSPHLSLTIMVNQVRFNSFFSSPMLLTGVMEKTPASKKIGVHSDSGSIPWVFHSRKDVARRLWGTGALFEKPE
jgi:hypothetical protein